MPIVAAELTEADVMALATPGTHAVGGVTGLCLQVTHTGARSWLLRITASQRRREFGLGAFPTVTLQVARDKARALREKIGGGADPALQRRTARAARRTVVTKSVTFKACAEAFLAAELTGGADVRHAARVLQELERHVFPALGRQDVRRVTTDGVLSIVQPLWTTKFATATKLRGHIERVLRFGISTGIREEPNPARWTGHLDAMLPAPSAVRRTERHPALPPEEMPAFIAELRTMPGLTARALEAMILTATRPADIRSMIWNQIDFEAKHWALPPDKNQPSKSRVVPLTVEVLDLLMSQPQGAPQAIVFSAPRSGNVLSDMALTAVIRRMNVKRKTHGKQPWGDPTQGGREVVPHGFRSTFRAWAEQRNYPSGVVHAVADPTTKATLPTTASSNAPPLGDAVALMTAWSSFCTGR